jgi:Tetratricopeptide repeat
MTPQAGGAAEGGNEPSRGPADAMSSVSAEGPAQVTMTAHVSDQGMAFQALDMTVNEGDTFTVLDEGHLVPAPGSVAAQVVDELLVRFQPPELYVGLLARIQRRRWVSVVGSAGSGKSALLAGLARPERCEGMVPDGFVHAVVFCDATTTQESLAYEVAEQLARSVPGFRRATSRVRDADRSAFASRAGVDRSIVEPLALLLRDPAEHAAERGNSAVVPQAVDVVGDGQVQRPVPETIRVVVDGLDQIRAQDQGDVIGALAALAADDRLVRVRLVVAHRDSALAGVPPDKGVLPIDAVSESAIERYLGVRHHPADQAHELARLCVRASSAWLAARLVADVYNDLGFSGRRQLMRALGDEHARTDTLGWLYNQALHQLPGWTPEAAADSGETWQKSYRPVLTALVAAGSGPVAPLPLLTAVSARFGGPADPDAVRDCLDTLGRLVSRTDTDTDTELVGLFHPTLVEHLSRDPIDEAGRVLDTNTGKRILQEAIEELAPVVGLYVDNPLYRWASEALAEHYWQFGMPHQALRTLLRRPLPTPRLNLDRWERWQERIDKLFGPRHPDTLITRAQIALFTGETGRPGAALHLYQDLLSDAVGVLGPRHPDTLITRTQIAYYTGQTGRPGAALHLYQDLLPVAVGVLGPRHPDTLTVRGQIAGYTGQTGHPGEALRLYQALLPDRVDVLGPGHPDTLNTRHQIAGYTGQTGHPGEALRLSQDLLPVAVDVLGPHHPDTLAVRGQIAGYTGETGHPGEALRLYQDLLPDRVDVLGPHHPGTLAVRGQIAGYTGQTGHPEEALHLFQDLLPLQVDVLGPRHPDTLAVRGQIAGYTGQTGHPEEALRLFQDLLPLQVDVLGPHHPDTETTRREVAFWTQKAAE